MSSSEDCQSAQSRNDCAVPECTTASGPKHSTPVRFSPESRRSTTTSSPSGSYGDIPGARLKRRWHRSSRCDSQFQKPRAWQESADWRPPRRPCCGRAPPASGPLARSARCTLHPVPRPRTPPRGRNPAAGTSAAPAWYFPRVRLPRASAVRTPPLPLRSSPVPPMGQTVPALEKQLPDVLVRLRLSAITQSSYSFGLFLFLPSSRFHLRCKTPGHDLHRFPDFVDWQSLASMTIAMETVPVPILARDRRQHRQAEDRLHFRRGAE